MLNFQSQFNIAMSCKGIRFFDISDITNANTNII